MRGRVIALTVAALALLPLGRVEAGGDVKFVVLKERGVGTAAQAQPFVDKLMAIAQKKQGWSSAKGTFFTERKAAEDAIDKDKPQFGIVSLGAYLAMKEPRKLETIGQVKVSRAGGQQYHLVSKTASDLGGCKGQKLATDHAEDTKFVDRVISGSSFKRPLQAMKMVIKDEAKCALIDDAQLAELPNVDGGKGLKSVWKSATLPPMAVVAFPNAGADQKTSFKNGLSALCEGEGKSVCGEVGIESLKPAGDEAYAQVLAAYRKDK
jgi:hypothetical protein